VIVISYEPKMKEISKLLKPSLKISEENSN